MRQLTCLVALLWTIMTVPLQAQNEDILWAADWGHRYIAIGGNYDSLLLLPAQAPLAPRYVPVEGTITKLRWHPTRPDLAITVQGGPVRAAILNLWTLRLDPLSGVSQIGARALGWNHDGTLLAVGDNEGLLHIYNQQGLLMRSVKTGMRSITGLSWHPSKNLIAMVSGKIGLYDYETDSTSSFESRSEEVLILSVVWHPSGRFFATGDYGDYTYQYPPLLQFWNEKGQKLKELKGSKAEYRNLAWSKDGSILATASDALRLWSKEGELLEEHPAQSLLWGLSWSEDEKELVTTDITGNILLWSKGLTKIRELKY